MTKVAHVAQWKKDRLQQLTDIIKNNKTVAVVSIAGIPAPQVLAMRKSLRNDATMLVAKNTLITIALKNASGQRKGIEKLSEGLDGQCALIGTNFNAFKLYKMMEKTKIKSPARGGEKAPEDIMVKEGDTSFKPGPIIGELQKVGIPAAIDKGKVIIKKDKVVVEKGNVINRDLAQMLAKMEIFPITMGIDLKAAHEGDMAFKPEHLHIDDDMLRGQIQKAVNSTMNLAMFAAYITAQTKVPLVQKAYRDSMAICIKAGVLNKASAPFIVAKAYTAMLSVASKMKDGLDDDLKGLVAGAAVSAAPAQADEEKPKNKPDKDDKPPEPSGEDLAGGLGALFG